VFEKFASREAADSKITGLCGNHEGSMLLWCRSWRCSAVSSRHSAIIFLPAVAARDVLSGGWQAWIASAFLSVHILITDLEPVPLRIASADDVAATSIRCCRT